MRFLLNALARLKIQNTIYSVSYLIKPMPINPILHCWMMPHPESFFPPMQKNHPPLFLTGVRQKYWLYLTPWKGLSSSGNVQLLPMTLPSCIFRGIPDTSNFWSKRRWIINLKIIPLLKKFEEALMAKRRLSVRKIKEVIWLYYEKTFLTRQIKKSSGVGRSTVHDYLYRASEKIFVDYPGQSIEVHRSQDWGNPQSPNIYGYPGRQQLQFVEATSF